VNRIETTSRLRMDIIARALRVPAMDEPSPATPRVVIIRETPIELCQFLKFGGLAESGGEAKLRIAEGKVLVNGTVETRKRKKLGPGDTVTLDGQSLVVQVGSSG
jgi:ribosome-associated protein